MKIQDQRNGVITYKLYKKQGRLTSDLNTVSAASYARESNAVYRMERTIGNLGLSDLNQKLGTNYTIVDLRSEVMVKDLQVAAAYGGSALFLWAMLQTVGAPSIISAATAVV